MFAQAGFVRTACGSGRAPVLVRTACGSGRLHFRLLVASAGPDGGLQQIDRRMRDLRPEGWTIAHKTGTGQVYGSEQAGYNDIGILTSPDGHPVVAMMPDEQSADRNGTSPGIARGPALNVSSGKGAS